jgi:hypothetical protein
MTDRDAYVELEPDPTPLVLQVGRTLRASLRDHDLRAVLEDIHGEVVLKAAGGPQSATLRFAGTGVRIDHGGDPAVTQTLIVRLDDRFALVEAVGVDSERAAFIEAVTRVLRPPLPAWRDAARSFWGATSADAGMPRRMVVNCVDDIEPLELGEGEPRYVIEAGAEELSRVFSGTDLFLDQVFAGRLAVRGTLTQLSVMAGASLKVSLDA